MKYGILNTDLFFFLAMLRDLIPLPQKKRIPLTKVQDFVLHVEHRALDRAEFDKKVINCIPYFEGLEGPILSVNVIIFFLFFFMTL